MNKSEDLKSFAKKNLRGIYNFASAFRYGLNISKERQLSEKITNSTHDTNVSVDSPLKIIVVNSGPKRLNIVFKDFPKDICENKKRADFSALSISCVSVLSDTQFCDFMRFYEVFRVFYSVLSPASSILLSVSPVLLSKSPVFFADARRMDATISQIRAKTNKISPKAWETAMLVWPIFS